MEKIKVNGKEIPMMKDTGASLTLISKKLWKQIGQPKLEEKNTGIETYDKRKMKYLGVFFSTVFYNNKELNVMLLMLIDILVYWDEIFQIIAKSPMTGASKQKLSKSYQQ